MQGLGVVPTIFLFTLKKLILYYSKPQNHMCDCAKDFHYFDMITSELGLFFMTCTFNSGGFFPFLVTLAHGVARRTWRSALQNGGSWARVNSALLLRR